MAIDLPQSTVQAAYDAYWATLDKHGVEPRPRAAMEAALQAALDEGGIIGQLLVEKELAKLEWELAGLRGAVQAVLDLKDKGYSGGSDKVVEATKRLRRELK